MQFPTINTRDDLDALAGTEAHKIAMQMLAGTIYRVSKDESAKKWVVLKDTSAIDRLGLSLKDFPGLTPPQLPEYIDDAKPSPQEEAWTKIKAMRDHRSSEGGFKVKLADGTVKWFHSDLKARTQQMSLLMMGANLPAGVQWKTLDGSFVTMTPTLAQAIFASAVAQEQATFTAAEKHRAGMLACAAPEHYDFSAGWPPIFGEHV